MGCAGATFSVTEVGAGARFLRALGFFAAAAISAGRISRCLPSMAADATQMSTTKSALLAQFDSSMRSTAAWISVHASRSRLASVPFGPEGDTNSVSGTDEPISARLKRARAFKIWNRCRVDSGVSAKAKPASHAARAFSAFENIVSITARAARLSGPSNDSTRRIASSYFLLAASSLAFTDKMSGPSPGSWWATSE